MPKDYYSILGVSKTANEYDIKKAYRRLAQQYHPDKHKGDKEAEQKFKDINQAYEVLSDGQKRATYDQFGEAGEKGFGGTGNYGGQTSGFTGQGYDFSSFGDMGGFSDIFETFFGQQATNTSRRKRGRRGPRPGEDIEYDLNITFEEAVFGAEKDLLVTKTIACDRCRGTGAEPGSKTILCPLCKGTGEVRAVRQTLFGQMATSQVCSECYGEGKTIEKKCSQCYGQTRIRSNQKVRIKIPAGVDNGSTIRLSGKGEAGTFGGPSGDLYIHLKVGSSKNFVRNAHDLYCDVHVHPVQAILGDTVEVNTIYGNAGGGHDRPLLKIPAGTQSGKVFRMKGYGVKKLKSEEKGDQFIRVVVDIPTKLSRKEKALYEELAKETGIDIKNQKDGFFGF